MLLLDVAMTFATALVASALSLVTQFRPRYRPFGRHGWWYTSRAALWIAAVTTAAVYLAMYLASGPVPAQVWAFVVPPTARTVHRAARRGRRSDEESPDSPIRRPMQLLTLFLPLVLSWLEENLGSLKDRTVQEWAGRMQVTGSDPEMLIARLKVKLQDRRVVGTAELRRRLDSLVTVYRDAHAAWAGASPESRPRRGVDLTVAVEGILMVAYEARADHLVPASRSRWGRKKVPQSG
ncbi:MAG TPA: hypothetical protein VFB84_00545 [Micromonosporaceae bacterium]|nr:hypothetical protein [Micromonosporaceae bacterium]